MTTSIIIGSPQDPHVVAVAAAMGHRVPLVLDVEQLAQMPFEVGPNRVRLWSANEEFDLTDGWRGWLRRLSPVAWEAGVVIGSHDAASKAAWLSLLASLLRYPGGTWLSSLDDVNSAENKLTQYTAALDLGLAVPATVVTNRPGAARIHPDLVAKPLGPGHFRNYAGRYLTVFIIQQRLHAVAHLRVVTVLDRAWVFRLDGRGLPIDWREEPKAHRDWLASDDAAVAAGALNLVSSLRLGYSSQDWVETADGRFLLDLNPSGQWLFLPEPGAGQIRSAIADWLSQ
jgi:hypothetical protein